MVEMIKVGDMSGMVDLRRSSSRTACGLNPASTDSSPQTTHTPLHPLGCGLHERRPERDSGVKHYLLSVRPAACLGCRAWFPSPIRCSAASPPTRATALRRALVGIGEELAAVYAADVDDHSEARGDNAQLFGLKVWVHGRYRNVLRFEDDPDVLVVDNNGSYAIRVKQFSVGVYKLGDTINDDIHACFPDASPTKRAFAERNRLQLSLFDATPASPLPAAVRYACNELIVGHFGNPRDGMAKWYIGASLVDELGRSSWAWVERQDLKGIAARPTRTREPIIPFSAREAEPLDLRPRRDDSAAQSE